MENEFQEITYDQLQRMKYMDSVVKEALRLLPVGFLVSTFFVEPLLHYFKHQPCHSLPALIQVTQNACNYFSSASSRICNKACTVGSVSIDEGVYVAADVWSIHRSKQIWGPDADQFVPERFILTYLSFSHYWICTNKQIACIKFSF